MEGPALPVTRTIGDHPAPGWDRVTHEKFPAWATLPVSHNGKDLRYQWALRGSEFFWVDDVDLLNVLMEIPAIIGHKSISSE